MSEYLQHGKFKYIDKWRSKTGNWVYKYADAANDKIRDLNDRYGPKVKQTITAGGRSLKYPQGGYDQKATTTTKNLIGGRTVSKQTVYKKSGRPSRPEWQYSKRDKTRTTWRKIDENGPTIVTNRERDKKMKFAGYDLKRIALHKVGKNEYRTRTEYRDSKLDAEMNRRYSMENAASRGNKFMKTLGSLNDKYGPKFIEEHKFASSTGMVFVDSYVRNVIGGKKVRVESYSYEAD